jgi:hypothetical protein
MSWAEWAEVKSAKAKGKGRWWEPRNTDAEVDSSSRLWATSGCWSRPLSTLEARVPGA